jgi:hypothetical protein
LAGVEQFATENKRILIITEKTKSRLDYKDNKIIMRSNILQDGIKNNAE